LPAIIVGIEAIPPLYLGVNVDPAPLAGVAFGEYETEVQ
jgi:hypothetical protein